MKFYKKHDLEEIQETRFRRNINVLKLQTLTLIEIINDMSILSH